MRILSVSAQKPDSTGSGIYLRETVRALDAMGHTQAVICGLGPDDNPVLPEGVAVHAVRFQTEALPFPVAGMSDDMPYEATRYRDFTPEMLQKFEAAFSAMVDAVLEAFEPDMVVCHHLYIVTAVVQERLAAWCNRTQRACRLCAVCHGTDLRQLEKHDLAADFVRHGIARIPAICALHDAQAADIARLFHLPVEDIAVVGTGYASDVFNVVPGMRAESPHQVIYAGKIWKKKGVESLIRALDLLPFEPDDFVLRLAGGSNNEEEYDAITQSAQRSRYRIEFLGALPQDALAREYNRAQVFVLPSFFEGLPLVLVEALACGCSAVITDLPGIRPWMQARVPKAPVRYVPPPRMVDVDTPRQSDLPAFEAALAEALKQACLQRVQPCAMDALSWECVARALLSIAR